MGSRPCGAIRSPRSARCRRNERGVVGGGHRLRNEGGLQKFTFCSDKPTESQVANMDMSTFSKLFSAADLPPTKVNPPSLRRPPRRCRGSTSARSATTSFAPIARTPTRSLSAAATAGGRVEMTPTGLEERFGDKLGLAPARAAAAATTTSPSSRTSMTMRPGDGRR
jgi:hypothetical protein